MYIHQGHVDRTDLLGLCQMKWSSFNSSLVRKIVEHFFINQVVSNSDLTTKLIEIIFFTLPLVSKLICSKGKKRKLWRTTDVPFDIQLSSSPKGYEMAHKISRDIHFFYKCPDPTKIFHTRDRNDQKPSLRCMWIAMNDLRSQTLKDPHVNLLVTGIRI